MEKKISFIIFKLINLIDKLIQLISNRCYVGYSFKNNLPSFAHGNYLSKYKSIGKNSISNGIIQFTLFRKNSYLIQNNFSKFDKTELFLIT